jgi:L-rhamnose isomerase/sugar isomerase
MKRATGIAITTCSRICCKRGSTPNIPASEIRRAYAQALLVDREALEAAQESNDALLATETLKRAFRTDVEPILAMARLQAGGVIDPVATYRASGYRAAKAAERPAAGGSSSGIV